MRGAAGQLIQPEVKDLLAARKFREVRDALASLEPADVADVLEGLETDEAAVAYRVLPRDDAAQVFADMEADDRERLLEALGDERALRVIESLDPDDRAHVLDELPAEVARQMINRLSPETRRITQVILGYAEQTVGRLMTPHYVRMRPEWTIARALDTIRKYGQDAETVHWVYVIDPDGTLVDDIHIRSVLLADPSSTIADIMDSEFIALVATDDQEEAVRVMTRYDRTALPVVDSRGVLVGIVTADDIADVAEEEFTEDVHKLGGLEALSQPYMATRFGEMVRKRGGWLAALFVFQLLTIAIMGLFHAQLEAVAVLAVFVPLIISTGGNTGTQAASMLVRALALDEVGPADWWRIVRKEIATGLCLGSVLGVLGVLTVVLAAQVGLVSIDATPPLKIGFIVGTAVVGIVIWGTLIGSVLPLLMERLGQDPATSSSPLVATMMDVSGLVIYLTVATIVLGGAG